MVSVKVSKRIRLPSRQSAMALQGPFVVVTDSPAPDLLEALRAAGAFPIVETDWADADSGLVLGHARSGRACRRLRRSHARRGAIQGACRPAQARATAPSCPLSRAARGRQRRPCRMRLSIAANAPAERIATRLASALRIRTLHSTVLRRTRTLATAAKFRPNCRRAIRLTRRPCCSPAAAAPIRSCRSRSANRSASSARSAWRARRARSTPATSTAW